MSNSTLCYLVKFLPVSFFIICFFYCLIKLTNKHESDMIILCKYSISKNVMKKFQI